MIETFSTPIWSLSKIWCSQPVWESRSLQRLHESHRSKKGSHEKVAPCIKVWIVEQLCFKTCVSWFLKDRRCPLKMGGNWLKFLKWSWWRWWYYEHIIAWYHDALAWLDPFKKRQESDIINHFQIWNLKQKMANQKSHDKDFYDSLACIDGWNIGKSNSLQLII